MKAKFTQTLCDRTIPVPNEINAAIVYQQTGMNELHVVNALNYLTLVCNVISDLVELVKFAMVKFDNFFKNELIAVQLKFFDEQDTRIVVCKSKP